MSRYIYSFIIAILAIISCTPEQSGIGENYSDCFEISIEGSISQVSTKATANGFVNNDAVGLFAVNYLDNNTVKGILENNGNQVDNVKYTFDESNHIWTPSKKSYYKNRNTNVDIYIYYPFLDNINNVSSFGFEVEKDQSAQSGRMSDYEASDFLWGAAEDVKPGENPVRITMNHKLSSLKVTLVEGQGFEDGEFVSLDKSVIVTNTTRKTTIDFSTGEVTAIGAAQEDGIVMCPQEDCSWKAIVVPQVLPAGCQLLSITIDGVPYAFSHNDAVEFYAGLQRNISVIVNRKNFEGSYELSLYDDEIVPWTEDIHTHGGEARQYYIVDVKTPGSLGETIKNAGKNPDKIKNLKVNGEIDETDFYFMRDNMAILQAVNLGDASTVTIPDNAFNEKKSLYYFVFPETIASIGQGAFCNSGLCGSLVIPEGVTIIKQFAFYGSNAESVILPSSLNRIEDHSFADCKYLRGTLLLPESLEHIGEYSFHNCDFSGQLILPQNLKYLGKLAFSCAGEFSGGIIIPENITEIKECTFEQCGLTGFLDLNNVCKIGRGAFARCNLCGELVIPEGVTIIHESAFYCTDFFKIQFPSTLVEIGEGSFMGMENLCEPLTIPEGVDFIDDNAFNYCVNLPSVTLPSTIEYIGNYAFNGCYLLSKLICNAEIPPYVQEQTFYYVPKDNFTLEVPQESVDDYRSVKVWSDFKRISGHYDFSFSRDIIRCLNGAYTKKLTVRAPSGSEWKIIDKPDWIEMVPSSGTGKVDVEVTVSELSRENTDKFSIVEQRTDGFLGTSDVKYRGRSGEIVIELSDNKYQTSLTAQQFNCEYADGEVQCHYKSSKGDGIALYFIGDGYDAKDIASGTFASNVEDGIGHMFDIEPYKTYKDYFDIYSVVTLSNGSGIGTENTVTDNKFQTYITSNRLLLNDPDACFQWVDKCVSDTDFSKSLTIMLLNSSVYEGVCYMYDNGAALAICPVSDNPYPYDFRGIIQHEAGGHGFGKLADEYITRKQSIRECQCNESEHPKSDYDTETLYGRWKEKGWYKNVSMNSNPSIVPWSHLIFNPQYSDYVDMYIGGFYHSGDVYRSEITSCMNNNIPYYSAISRQEIVERIMHCAGQAFSLEDFYSNDVDSQITKSSDRTYGVSPYFHLGTYQAPVYAGKKPNL